MQYVLHASTSQHDVRPPNDDPSTTVYQLRLARGNLSTPLLIPPAMARSGLFSAVLTILFTVYYELFFKAL